MDDARYQLIEPGEGMREEYLAFLEEFCALGDGHSIAMREKVCRDYAAFLRKSRDDAAGRNLEPERVPYTFYWLVRDGRILGQIGLRPRLNEILSQHGGHISYRVRPSERGRGYATRMLAMVLNKARELGLTRVMLTCDRDNIASARVIQKNGGQLEAEYLWEENGKQIPIQRYWIDLV